MTDGTTSDIWDGAATTLGGDRRHADQVSPYERLKTGILDGVLEPGSPLVEAHVAKWCGVSRTPAREALTRLEQDGLVERTDRGLTVKKRSPEEILDIYDIRITMEGLVATYAAERYMQLDRLRLERALETAVAATESEYAANNREFHRVVWAASHNEALIGLLERLSSHLTRYPATTLTYPGRWDEALEEHRELVDLIVARDSEGAASVARKHFARARDIRLELYKREIV